MKLKKLFTFYLVITTLSISTGRLVIANSVYNSEEPGFFQWLTRCSKEAKDAVCRVVETAESTPLRLLFVFFLGVLMSLTPCIYPMIPITVGVLQAQAGTSLWSHSIRTLAYAVGMALTFALLGLLAALSGNVFGQLLSNPVFVILLVAMLAYLAFSMFGLYEIRLPRFLTMQRGTQSGSSPLSAFLFGVASGGIASPCLSPGLALVLSMVATMGNKFLGFLMLFLFGIGTSLPLLVVGTFSGALTRLPKAGPWMLEIKKIFGFMLLGMCFYYLNNILPTYITLALTATSCFLGGIYYFANVKPADTELLKKLKNIFGMLFIVASALIGWQAFKAWMSPAEEVKETFFTKDLASATAQARAEGKKLFLDFGAYYCTSCKYIEKNILSAPVVRNELERFVPVYVDGSDSRTEPFATLRKKYTIIGFPMILLIEPETGEVIKKWGSELADLTPAAFAQELKNY